MNNRLSLCTISIFTLIAYAPAAVALQIASSPASSNTAIQNNLSPSALVSMAYQGYFKSQGIPASGALLDAFQEGRVSAEDLVKSAVKTNQLPAQALQDREYLSAVNGQLNNLFSDQTSN